MLDGKLNQQAINIHRHRDKSHKQPDKLKKDCCIINLDRARKWAK